MQPIYVIDNHQLHGVNVTQTPSPNHGQNFASGLPDTIVMHYTAGSSVNSSVSTMCNPANKVSAHLVIGRKGQVVQLVDFNTIAWHAGRSSWQGRTGLNKYSIGIELDNAGPLTQNDDGLFLSWFNKAYTGEEVFKGKHRNQSQSGYWHAYTEAQILVAFDVCRLLCETYGIKTIVGHEEIAPGRKSDPGPAFPLDKLRNNLLESRDQEGSAVDVLSVENTGIVTVPKLNIRSGPGANFKPVAPPLTGGATVQVKERYQGWAKVDYVVSGWVSEKYIK
ncbi:N-acetylmuramoyl-L-alanine amidase [Alteromonas sp. ASW11-36]|uniref:N-acetylmuramoyl-L-alanine amidase n=1 Tax=Alteromonas arenosi TaxID=3055817 RepID=A0ABT7STE5_9ALTE|nr:N-acetylmuramoyl-L-alanine amidase [Alteromonas sp. ASW11-36]MDM7859466.1 N-acetylmuramoyl-L-alanine amidase [Alteromonas sp. ASW11-36]